MTNAPDASQISQSGWQPIESVPADTWVLVPQQLFSGKQIAILIDESDKGYGKTWFDNELEELDHLPEKWMPLPDGMPSSPSKTTIMDDAAFPLGAIHNGRAFIQRFKDMDTTSAAGSYEFSEIERCFEYIAEYLLRGQTPNAVLDRAETVEAVIKELLPPLKLFFRWEPEDFAEQITMKVFAKAAIRAIKKQASDI